MRTATAIKLLITLILLFIIIGGSLYTFAQVDCVKTDEDGEHHTERMRRYSCWTTTAGDLARGEMDDFLDKTMEGGNNP